MGTAPVIDFEVLLAPIAGDNPAGADLSATSLFAELNEMRRADDAENVGDWAPKEVKTANWSKLVKVAIETLSTKSKDLRVAAHLAEALVQQHGMAGLRDGLRLVRELQETYWDNVYPLIETASEGAADQDEEEGGIEVRAAAVGRLDRLLPMPVRFVKATKPGLGDTPLTHADWEMANYLDHELKGKSQEAYQQAIDEGKPTGDAFRRAVAATPRSFYEGLVANLDDASEELAKLNQLSEARYAGVEEVPYLTSVGKAIDSINQMVSEIEKTTGALRKKEGTEGDAADTIAGAVDGGGPAAPAAFTGQGIPTQPVDRADALRRLQAVAEYFRKAEPHSPVTYLVERAITWAAMPLDQWLAEIVKDEGSLTHIRETLGVKRAE